MASKVRFGIIGTGGIANAHATALKALEADAEIVSCCDVVPGKADEFANRWDIEGHYNSAKAMLDAGRLDIVCVSTPHPHHRRESSGRAIRARGSTAITTRPA